MASPSVTRRHEQLQEVTDAALAHLELEKLLGELLKRIKTTLDVDTCAFLLLDEETNELVARAALGIEEEVEQGVRVPYGVGFAGRVAAERRPVFLTTVDAEHVFNAILWQKGIKSLLGVPLLVAGRVIGVLHVGSLVPREFEQADADLLQLVAERAALAIEHARVYEAERRARERFQNLQAITDAALAHLDLDDLLNELLLRIRSILSVDTCAILLLDEETNELVARAAVGIEEEVEQGVRVPVGGGFAGRVAATRQPVFLPNVDHANVLNPILRRKGIKSLLGVPLVVSGRVIGVLHVGSLAPREFGTDDVDLLQLVGDRASIAIEHARAYDAERRARTRLENVQAVTDAALAHLELDDLLGELLLRIITILDVDTCAILLLDEETNELVARAAVGIEEEVEQGIRIPVGGGFAGRVAATKKPVFLPDVDHAHVLNPILRQKGIKSMLGVPLLVDEKVIGVLHVGRLVHTTFERDAIDLLQLVAERAALAIAKARVHDETVRLDQLKLNFVAIASHELRTPATSVYGMLATLSARREVLDEATQVQLQEVAFQEAGRLRRLIEQLLDLSRLDAQSLRIQPQPVVLRRVLEDIVGGAGSGDVELDVEPDLAVVVDPLVLDRVVSNLVGNALRHGAAPIEVSAAQRDRHLRIAVKDHGPGVPDEMVPRLFDRFVRGESGGTGLGLAIAKTYAQAHGGDLVFHPEAGGAKFELVLPRG